MIFADFLYFSCNSLVKNHHGSPTGLHGSPTVRLPSGPVQSGRSSPVWSGPVCYGPVRYGPVQPVRSDLVWSGDPWSIPQIGLVWSGLGGFQKIRSPISRGDRTVRNKWPAPTCVGYVLDMFYTRSGHMLDMFLTCGRRPFVPENPATPRKS